LRQRRRGKRQKRKRATRSTRGATTTSGRSPSCPEGATLERSSLGDITIYEWKFFHVNRKWLYTAITRATDLSKVYFFDYDEAKQEEQEMLDYLQKKVERYKQQDRKAKRPISEHNYITKEWLASCIGKSGIRVETA